MKILNRVLKFRNQQKAEEEILYIHIFSHTHWDFEWYEVHEGFKLQLVPLIEHLLDTLEKDPDFKFHFDGQVMPIMDYLEILREEDDCDDKNRVGEANRKISKFVKRGQLILGPCWSTPETSLISCESLIRNINRGIRFSSKFGVASSVFYNADAFQYHSQLPQIIEGSGLKSAFTWRAYKHGKTLKDLSIWEGADKTSVLRYYPPRSYAQIWHLPIKIEDAVSIIKDEAEFLKKFAVTKHVLITQGNDQFEAQSNINKIIKQIDEELGCKYRLNQVTLEDFFNKIEKENPKLDIIHGELTGNQWACTMSGQLSARMYLKQKNKEAEIAIEKWAEPFASFSWLLGYDYPAGLIERAWEYLMKQHFHHCNACAIDEVHREGEVRYKNSIDVANGIVGGSMGRIASKISTADIINDKESSLVIFNPSDVERMEVVKAEINFGIGVHNDAEWLLANRDVEKKQVIKKHFTLKDDEGNMIPYQILHGKEAGYEIAFWAEKIPPFGYKTYGIELSDSNDIEEGNNIAHEKENVLENDILKVKIKEDGSLSIMDKRNGVNFRNLNIIENTADHGDTYNYDPLKGDRPITTQGVKGKITLKENGPLLATIEAKVELALPESLTSDRKARSGHLRKLPILFNITLKKGSPLVYISANIDNQIKDHRLRVLFQGVRSDFVYVQTQCDVVQRRITKYKEYSDNNKMDISHRVIVGNMPKEKAPSPTQFQRNFVGTNDGKKGLVILNKGLPEYEAKTNGTIALTLLRSVGWLSQDDLSTREGSAGPIVPVPDAQCIGKHTFDYAILPQAGSWNATPIYRQENQYNIDIKFMEVACQKGELPTNLSFVIIQPDELMVSAIKKSYSEDNFIIRLFNPTNKLMKGSLALYPGIKEAWLANLNEEKKGKISPQSDGSILIELGPKKISTINITPKCK
ncbi:MAG: glycoside hydrolase family 38 C-terminal domain-containing protein [Spirochaetota bacterium]|nr:glycoside hydrolase family 38 C-terminal domain-containing protein [Spirochaetota bacterium]